MLKAHNIPVNTTLSKEGWRPEWMSKAPLAKLRQNKEVHRMWKKGQATGEEYRSTIRIWQVCVEESKGPVGIKSGKGYQGQEGFFKDISSKRKTYENVGPMK